jgi:glycosyltransferase involved in cell wall biosynthesis
LAEEDGFAQLRVAVVMGGVLPEQLALWRACKDHGSAITVVGTDWNVYEGRWPWEPRKPTDLETILLRPYTPRFLDRGQVWWFYRGFRAALRRIRPDIIHVLSEPWGGLVIQTLLERRLSHPLARVCIHGADNIYWHGSRVERSLRGLILRSVFPRLDGFASWSMEGVEVAKHAGLGGVPTAVVPAVIPEPEDFNPLSARSKRDLRANLGLPPDAPVVGFVGRLSPEKGILDLLRALNTIKESAPYLAIWGNGPLAGAVQARLERDEIKGRFFGPIGLQEVADAYQACDVIAVPSRTTGSWKEQFGRVLLEAMLSGSAIVAYRSGAIPEVVGDGALLVEEGDTEELSGAIRRLVGDPALRQKVGMKGRARALERFRPTVLAEQMLRFWDEVLR